MMVPMFRLFALNVLVFLLVLHTCDARRDPNCRNPVKKCKPSVNYFPKKNRIKIVYATKTIKNLKYSNSHVDFTIRGLGNSFFQYRLVVCGCTPGNSIKGRQVLYIDPKVLYINESPTLALFSRLAPNLNALKYVSNADFIYTPAVRDRVRKKSTIEITGPDFTTNYGKLKADSDLSASIIGAFGVTSYRAAGTGVPFLVISETQEASALARAEWMKLIGLYVNQAAAANKLFRSVAQKYEAVRQKALRADRRPSVFFNYPSMSFTASNPKTLDQKYVWFQPVKDQYITDLLLDANADYRYSNDGSGVTKGATLSKITRDFKSARFLIQSSSFPGDSSRTLEDYMFGLVTTSAPDKKFRAQVEKFAAVRCGNVWGHQRRITKDGQADDFFGSAVFRPDLVLADFVKILHPNLSRSGRFTYVYNYRARTKKFVGNCPYDVLDGKPPAGKVFFDKKFVIPKLSRFAVDDRLEGRILPQIRKQLKGSPRVEVFFRPKDQQKRRTVATVRTMIDMKSAKSFRKSKAILFAMRAALGNGVQQIA